jgi:hypothetical protein
VPSADQWECKDFLHFTVFCAALYVKTCKVMLSRAHQLSIENNGNNEG